MPAMVPPARPLRVASGFSLALFPRANQPSKTLSAGPGVDEPRRGGLKNPRMMYDAHRYTLLNQEELCEDPKFLQEQLITYIGNKRTLLPSIGKAIESIKKRTSKPKLACLDLFAGTGIVSRYLKKHSSVLVANDIELYSKITNECYLTNKQDVSTKRLKEAFRYISQRLSSGMKEGFIAELYAPADDKNIKHGERVFYTRRNAAYIDTVRQLIEDVDSDLQYFLLSPLLAEASVHANTSGVFKGFYKSKQGIGQFGGHGQNALSRILKDIELRSPIFSNFECRTTVHQMDANAFVATRSDMDFDVAYLDPPYNQHPYGSNYFMLNLIAQYERPDDISKVSGIPAVWNRSQYNKKQYAKEALFEIIEKCNAKFIIISYNSEGFIKKEDFLRYMKKIGTVYDVFETTYNTFRGSRNLGDRPIHVTEFLYLLEKN